MSKTKLTNNYSCIKDNHFIDDTSLFCYEIQFFFQNIHLHWRDMSFFGLVAIVVRHGSYEQQVVFSMVSSVSLAVSLLCPPPINSPVNQPPEADGPSCRRRRPVGLWAAPQLSPPEWKAEEDGDIQCWWCHDLNGLQTFPHLTMLWKSPKPFVDTVA